VFFYKPIELTDTDLTELSSYCFDDKKTLNGMPYIVVLEEIGKARPA